MGVQVSLSIDEWVCARYFPLLEKYEGPNQLIVYRHWNIKKEHKAGTLRQRLSRDHSGTMLTSLLPLDFSASFFT